MKRDALAEGRVRRQTRAAAPVHEVQIPVRLQRVRGRGRRPRGRPSRTRASAAPSGARSSTSLGVAERLLAVEVDDHDEVREPVVGGEHRRLPDRALVALGVAENDEARARGALQPCRQRRAGADREALAERAGARSRRRRRSCSGCAPSSVPSVQYAARSSRRARVRSVRARRRGRARRGPSTGRSGRGRDRPGR